MNCRECRQKIAHQLREIRTLEENPEIRAHLRDCELCREYCSDLLLSRALKEEQVPLPDQGFADKATDRAISRYHDQRRKRIFRGFSVAAAMLAIFFAGYFVHFATYHDPAMQQPIEVVVSESQEDSVWILIETKRDRRDAILTVDLEGKIDLKGFPDRRSVQWKTDLVQGRNLLELPVKLRNESSGIIRVGYRYDSREEIVSVHVKPPKSNEGKGTEI